MSDKTHIVSEDNPWSERIPDHGGRVETPAFTKAKATLHKIIAELGGFPFYNVGAATAARPTSPRKGRPR